MAKTGLYNVQTAYTQPNLPNVPSGFSQYAGGMSALAQGVGRVGNTLSRIQQEYVQAQDASTSLKLQTEFLQKTAELSAGLENHENPIRIPKDYEDGAKSILDGLIDSYGEKLSARGVDHIRNQLGFSIQKQVIQQTEFARRRLIDDAVVNFDAAFQAKMDYMIAQGDIDPASLTEWVNSHLDSITVGKNENAEANGLIPANVLSPAQADEIRKTYTIAAQQKLQKAAEQQAERFFQVQIATVIDAARAEGVNPFEAAKEWLDANFTELIKEQGLTVSDLSAMRGNLNGFAEVEANKTTVQNERAWQEQSGDFEMKAMNLIRQGDFDGVRELINGFNTDLPGEYRSKAANLINTYRGRLESELDRQAMDIEKLDKIQTNEMVRAAIGTIATDIWRGAATKAEFDEVLNNARYGKMVNGAMKYTFDRLTSDAPLIDDAAYRSLSSAADTELKGAQAEFIRNSVQSAADVIVGVDAGRFRRDDQGRLIIDDNAMDNILNPQKAAKLKERLNAVNRYETSLREWIAENPTATPKEARVYAEQLKYEYWDMSQEEIEAANKQRREFIKIPRPTSKEEYDAIPSGTIFIAPDGKQRRKP